MEFPFGVVWHRERRPSIPDPYSPGQTRPGSWADAASVELPGAYFAPSGSSDVPDADRSQVVSGGTLYIPDPNADVRTGDRVWAEPGLYFYVNARPAAEKNPFTGWQPLRSVPLDLVEG